MGRDLQTHFTENLRVKRILTNGQVKDDFPEWNRSAPAHL